MKKRTAQAWEDYRRAVVEAGGLDPSWFDRVDDDKEWRQLVRISKLSKDQLRWLRMIYHVYHDTEGIPSTAIEGRFRRWCVEVLGIVVELRPGGRAILRDPERDDYSVEIRWRSFHGERLVTSYQISRGGGLLWVEIPTSTYLAAFYLALSKEDPPPQDNPPLPASGKPASVGFYRNLLIDYDALVNEGHRSPAKELAARMKVNEGTLKTWLHRGRRYLEKGADHHG